MVRTGRRDPVDDQQSDKPNNSNDLPPEWESKIVGELSENLLDLHSAYRNEPLLKLRHVVDIMVSRKQPLQACVLDAFMSILEKGDDEVLVEWFTHTPDRHVDYERFYKPEYTSPQWRGKPAHLKPVK